ncbi:pantoate--beta-alanine ligase [Pseudobacillus wudalianchiensis]|uniref:Pantothenate synthetase n=1 Tax=Pseudobacillus wudalianchiensis TaxID=1743143 RepID=A0A1B9B9K5_9BACI|nr:pantoate--beta-alanine ligase [Bacillus wudalianchiensis]OCA92775.1 pantoate--beta-alanine ligase [Bacillus wudalianchiensis]
MRVIKTVKELKEFVRTEKKAGHQIGLVPTMGFLHEGHLTLANQARQENDTVIMSIFVNPLQFGPNEDFDRYPRNLERDEQLAASAGVDCLFTPDVEEMYPEPSIITMTVTARADKLCGVKRPGHFDGVVTVVTKLFHLAEPDKAYFGLKDAQQFAVIDGLVTSLNFPVEIVGVETVREEDGLAKSSRNVYLTEEERLKAPHLQKGLQLGVQAAKQGDKSVEEVIERTVSYLQDHTGAAIDYVELLSYPELDSLEKVQGKMILAAAVQYRKARLIDNIIFTVRGEC